MAQQMILILFLFLLPAAITAYQPESPLPPSDPCYEPPPPPSPSPPPPPSPSPPPPPSPSPPPPPSPSPPPPPSPSPPPPPSPSPPPPPSPSPPPPPPKCYPYGSITCKRIVYPTYTCSPPVTAYTQGVLRVYDFSILGDGYGPAKCDRKYHNNNERVVALSTGWYDGGRRCGNTIYIQANGKSTTAKVVDECDSTRGCDLLHRRPCGYNVVGGSKAVWKALKIDENEEEVKILWSTW